MKRTWLRRRFVFGILVVLLFFALRKAPLPEIWRTLQQLTAWQILVLLLINLLIYALITLRWWIILYAENTSIAYVPLIAVRLAVFGVSYFTLGPQVGGEPLQVLYLQRSYGLTYTRATASVLMDKLLEFLANFFLLAVGLTAIFQVGFFSRSSINSLLSLSGLVILLALPLLHIVLLTRGQHPMSAVLRKLSNHRLVRFVAASERMAGRFCRRHIRSLVAAAIASMCAALGLLSEYFLIVSFLHIDITFPQSIATWTAGWLAFLIPLPGGLGALEASQVWALSIFGIASASAISVTLLMRGRDLVFGGIGLLFAGHGLGNRNYN